MKRVLNTVRSRVHQSRYCVTGCVSYSARSLGYLTALPHHKPLLIPHINQTGQRFIASVEENQSKPEIKAAWTPKVIIFDKNGTLFDFHTTWTPWIQSLSKSLEAATGLKLEEKIYHRLNVCRYTNKTRHGLLAEGSSAQIKHAIEEILVDAGIPECSVQYIIDDCWIDCDINNRRTVTESKNIHKLFQDIKERGIKIAVCTTDNRRHTEKTLSTFGLLELVDSVKCADDPGLSKPDPSSVFAICKELGVGPEDTVVVGDTEADMFMGYQAGVGLTIGVLSGIGTRLDLSTYADYITEDIQQVIKLILPETNSVITNKAGQKSQEKPPGPKVKLVIFDKDGTLLCFHSMWTPWAKVLIQKLEDKTQLSLYEHVMQELGYCHQAEKWTPGILAEGTQHQNKEKVCGILQNKGVEEEKAKEIVDQAWTSGNHDKENEHVRILDNPTILFKILKENGVKVAICTADSREGTNQFVKSINAEEYVDCVVCGDDPNTEPKPSPRNALLICEKLGVDPVNAIVVGDTIADMGMGRSAKLGATVAVLSGVGGVKDLDSSADHVVSSIGQILPFVFRKRTHSKTSTSENK